ncbi:MAG: DUF4834 family protein [Bacteroidaceae bacterium]|nr:DUF4834 family protein [Bacteroidaceae bacterium]
MFLFVGFFVVASFGLSIIQMLMRLFGINTRQRTTLQGDETSHPDSQAQKRVFTEDEGEYVDFEEIRDADR